MDLSEARIPSTSGATITVQTTMQIAAARYFVRPDPTRVSRLRSRLRAWGAPIDSLLIAGSGE